MSIQEITSNYEKRIEELNNTLQSHGNITALKSYDMVSFIDATIIQMRKTIEDLKELK